MNPLTPRFLENTNDQFLLCDEVWDMSPVLSSSPYDHHTNNSSIHHKTITKHDFKFEHLFDTYLKKEIKYMTRSGYVNVLETNHFIANCRIKAIQWFIHTQKRFNFCLGTVFNAVNYVDRFIDINQCHGWSHWMMELLSLASLSVAIKFGETCPPSLHEIQEGLDYSFEARLIQKMELKLLNTISWELNSITPHSYVELIAWELSNKIDLDELSSRLNDVLLASSHDVKLLVYRPCVVAVSGLKCVLEDQDCISHITSFIPSDQQKNLQSCYKMMQEMLVSFRKSEGCTNPSSPDTVLNKEQVVIHEELVDLSFIGGPVLKKNVKRKRDQEDECVVKHKK